MSPALRLRIVSAIVLAAIALSATWLGGIVFTIFAVAIGLLIFYEWSTITGHELKDRYTLFGWAGMLVVLGQLLMDGARQGALVSLYLLVGFTVVAVLIAAIRGRSYWLAGGIFYAGLSGISLAALRDMYGIAAIVFIFAVVWGTDILAYFVGRAVGGPKLAPRISPGKTWSGAIGGTLSGVVAGCIVIWLVGENLHLGLVVFTIFLSIFSQIGDLFESFIKRRFGVKDSSHLIPGHGGVMDRVDGLVFACFLAFLGSLAVAVASGQLATASSELISGI
jgi:phosphatidate cytidylyltransferase